MIVMKRYAWLTDIHLNFIPAAAIDALADRACADVDLIVVSGDIAEAPSLESAWGRFIERSSVPVYWVLGNHDFYHGSISEVRARASTMPGYLPTVGVVDLGEGWALAGHDGWGDARLGNVLETPIQLNDFRLIAELQGLSRPRLVERLRALGDEAAEATRRALAEVATSFRGLVWVTHVPPFQEACWYEGSTSHHDWLPFFTCKAMGDALRQAAEAYPALDISVLCGHTHSPGSAQLMPNLSALTGAAEYGRPRVERVLVVPPE